jgi:hypothetical protein
MRPQPRLPYCWLNHASRAGQSVELHFVPDSNLFVRVMNTAHGISPTDRMFQQVGRQMHRLQSDGLRPGAAATEVVLSASEEASVSNNPHGSCTIQLTKVGERVGVMMNGGVSFPGLPPQTSSQFLPADAP